MPVIIVLVLFISISIIPIELSEKVNYSIQLLLVMTLYLLIINDSLPSSTNDNKTTCEVIITTIFRLCIFITFVTLWLQIFTTKFVRFHKLPYI